MHDVARLQPVTLTEPLITASWAIPTTREASGTARADDSKRGGDIDLLIVPDTLDARERLLKMIRFHAQLERHLGDRRLDVIVEVPGDDRAIVRVAHETGVRLQ